MTVRNRRLVAVLCIVVLCAAAMASPTSLSAASICAILVPLPALFGTVVSAPLAEPEPVHFLSSHLSASSLKSASTFVSVPGAIRRATSSGERWSLG